VIVVVVASAVLHLLRAPSGEDSTRPEDFEQAVGAPLPPAGIGEPQLA
jgi:hypothetical protein